MNNEIIAVINQKGGVGKTTTSVNMGAALAESGQKVLLVDIDAQCNLSTHLGAVRDQTDENNPEAAPVPEFTIYDVLKGSKEIKEVVINRSENLDVVPSSLLLSAADLELGGMVGRELILRKALDKIKNDYNFIIIDCPPALGLLSLNALAASHSVVIPVQSEYLALHGVRQLLDTVDQVREVYNENLSVRGVLICLHDSRKRLARAVSETIRSYFGDLVFNTVIRSNVSLAEAPASGQTVFEHAPKSSGSEDYSNLVKEMLS